MTTPATTTGSVPPEEKKPSRAGRNLPAAIGSGVVMSTVIIATLIWWHWGFVLLAAFFLGAATLELHQALAVKNIRTAKWPVLVGTVLTVLAAYWVKHPILTRIEGQVMPPNTVILAVLALSIVVALASRLPHGTFGFVRDASASVLVLGYCALLGSTIILMLSDSHPTARIAAFLFATFASDTGGYIAGVLFGKHPMVPTISPKKSWEGFAGSVLASTAMSVGLAHFALGCPWWVGLVLGPALATTGTIGDLVESCMKRDLGIKDMSQFIPGHGGIMDRLDSILVNAPVAWFILYCLMP